MDKNVKKILILGGVILAIVVIIFADKAFKASQSEKVNPDATEEVLSNDAFDKDETSEKDVDKNVEDSSKTEKDDASGSDDKSADKDSSDDKGSLDNKDSSGDKDTTTDESTVEDNSDKDASEDDEVSYEEWLAAGVVTAISMHYIEFDIDSIYLLSENSMANKDESKGVYVAFKFEGKDVVIHSAPLPEERSYPGTIDFSTQNFGLASFDEVEVNEAELRKATEIELDEIIELVSQLMLVTIYEH